MQFSFDKLIFKLQNFFSASSYDKLQKHWLDISIITILAGLGGILTYQGSQLLHQGIVDPDAYNVWFGADCPRVFDDMVRPEADHYRTKVHPLFVILTLPVVLALKLAFGIEALTAVRLVIATVAGLWLGTFFLILRLISCRRFDATLFSILAMTSAAAIFWFVVPETYSFGSLSILIGLCFFAITLHYSVTDTWYVIVSALTLSFTITNWMVGILATFINYQWRRALQITVNGFCVVVLLWSVQKAIFPTVQFFLGDREEKKYINMAASGGVLTSLKSFIFHSLIMPSFNVLPNNRLPHWQIMSVQASAPGSGSIWGYIAVGLWAGLLGLGIWAIFSIKKHLQFRLLLGFTILGQLALHSIYGDETFLFSLHFAPLLVLLVALSTLTRARTIALALTGMLVITVSINNNLQFSKVIDFFDTQGPQRQQVIQKNNLPSVSP
ncbi:hypothetical protein [Nostoc sp. TCL26-01]|uniref:hypothetical protein n=1 Tax=Nostoc sp. TCL26-01 TaxID=2576904 RepID=UPI0015B7DBFC|nr:hypothetical protein [Nostoc sp. TCL26-01]QLE57520.1 hypothetical protein FD725_19575 [Nostoc sp. TCL26-01]